MGNIESLVTGLSQGLNQYLQAGQAQQRQQQTFKAEADTQEQMQEKLKTFEQGQSGIVTPEMGQEMFSQVSPEFGQAAFKAINDFKTAKGRDMTLDEANKFMDPVMRGLMMKAGKDKTEKTQTDAFNKLKQSAASMRGDPAFGDITKQQTAVGMGYRTLADARTGNVKLTPAVWADVLGQTWKARTGGVPTDQVMKDLRQGNVVEAMRNTLNEISGYQLNQDVQPKVVIDNMLDFLKQTGDDVDQRFKDLAAVHLVRDENIKDEDYNKIEGALMQRSFNGYTQTHQQKITQMRQKEASQVGNVGTSGTTKRGTKFKVVS